MLKNAYTPIKYHTASGKAYEMFASAYDDARYCSDMGCKSRNLKGLECKLIVQPTKEKT